MYTLIGDICSWNHLVCKQVSWGKDSPDQGKDDLHRQTFIVQNSSTFQEQVKGKNRSHALVDVFCVVGDDPALSKCSFLEMFNQSHADQEEEQEGDKTKF